MCLLALGLLLGGAGPAAAQSDTTFVKNTGQTAVSGSVTVGHSGGSRWEQAASFTTGDNSTGYTLSEVDVSVASGISGNSPQVSIYTTTSADLPDSSLYVLTNPASLTASAVNTFTADSGATLQPNTTYAVVLQQTGTSGLWSVRRSDSDDEDSGAASGWSIADQRAWRNAASTTTWSTSSQVLMIAIKGTLGSSAANNAPTVANEIPDQSITASTAFSYQFPANTFNDADGDTLTYTATQADGSALPVWLSFTASSRTFSGTVPAAGSHGDSASIKVTASDGTDSVSDTFDIVVNEVPTVANQIPDQTATAGAAFSFTFPANTFNDADASDTLTYTATKGDDSELPSWLSLASSTRTFSGTPAAADVGTLSVKVTATDDTASASVSDTFDITVSAAPSTSPAANTLVSNIDQTGAGNIISFTSDIAQRFTTGANTSGYKLTRVDIRINGGSGAPGYTATIREGNAAAPSGTIAGTLTKPTLQSGDHNAQFTSSDGIDLKPNTPYWVMLDVSSTGSGNSARTTSSNNQTGEKGWAIMDSARWRAHGSTGGWTTNQHAVRIRVLGSAIPAALSSATADGTTLTLHFNGALDRTATAPAASAFTVTAGGSDQTPTGLTVGVSTVTLTLGTAVTADQTVTVAYAKPAMNPLQDANGNEVAGFTGQAVTNSTGAAAVSGVAISSTPSNDADSDGTADTYGLGEKIRVQLTFGSAVTVDTSGGTPRLKIKLVQDKWANYESGSGTKVLTFAYTVVDGNASSDGTAVLADTLELNGGTITSGGSNADLAHGGLVHDLAHKVDASLMTDNSPPTFHGADVKGTTLAVTFDEALDTSSAPAGSVFRLSDGKAGTGTVSISGRTATVTLGTAVTAGQTVTVAYAKPGTNPLRDAAGNEVADFIGQAVTNNTGVPAVTGVAISSTPSHDTDTDGTPDTYGEDEKIRVQLTFDEAVTVVTTGGTPRLKIKLVQEKWADYESGSGTTVLTFAYTVLAGNMSSDGIEVLQNTLQLNSGTIRDAQGNNALLAHAAVARDASHKVNGGLSDSTAPTFQSATVNGATLTVTFNENLDTGSAPAGSAFTTSGSRTGTGTVSISGATATVTLDSAATAGETVTVSYTLPGTNPLQDASGNDVASFTGQAVTNNTPAATPPTAANKLVGNTGKTISNVFGWGAGATDAQGFTTGSNGAGYTLTGVGLNVFLNAAGTTEPTYALSIWSSGSDGNPDSSLGTLTNPASVSTGVNSFTHSPGIDLDANTTYFVVLEVTAVGDKGPQYRYTASDDEDGSPAAGWSVANRAIEKNSAGEWQEFGLDVNMMIAVHGSAKPNSTPTVANEIPDQTATAGTAFSYQFPANTFADADTGTTLSYTATKSDGTALPSWLDFDDGTRTFSGTPAATDAGTLSVKVTADDGTASVSDTFDITVSGASTPSTGGLVSNTGKSTDGTSIHNIDRAQSFTTGSNTGGYTLTSVTFPIGGSIDTSVTEVRIESSNSSNEPGGSLGTLTLSQSGTTVTGTNTGIDLDANTTYFVVLQSSDSSNTNTYQRTNSDDEDAGAAAGWSIGDGSLWDGDSTTGWRNTSNQSWKLAVHGYAKNNNTPTVANEIPDQTATAGTAFSYAFPANTFNDADGDTLTYTAAKSDGTALPDWLSFDAGTRTFSGTPTAAETLSVKVTASDSVVSVSDTFDIVVTSLPPVLADVFVRGATLTLLYAVELDESSAPADSDFRVFVNASLQSLENVAVRDRRVVLTLNAQAGEQVSAGGSVTVSYSVGANPIKNTNGDQAAAIPTRSVRNLAGDKTAPRLTGLWVQGTTMTLVYNEALDPDSVPFPGSFGVNAVAADQSTSRDVDVTKVAVTGRRVVLTLASAVAADETVTLQGYNAICDPDDSSPPDACHPVSIQDYAGNLAALLADELARHGTPPPDSAPSGPSGGGGPGGGPGGLPDTGPPDFGGATVAPLSLAAGRPMDRVVLPEATGGDGALSYALSSVPAGLAGLDFDPATRTLSGTPDRAGGYEFAYTAHDADANTSEADAAVLSFAVQVVPDLDPVEEAVRRTLGRTLAAVGTRTLASALGNIGARLADGVPGSGLTLAGQPVGPGTLATREGPREGPCAPRADARFRGAPDCAAEARSVGPDELLGSSAFALALSEADGAPQRPLWAVWGRGDLGAFEGRPEPGARHEGELRTAWLGVDARSGPWVAGLAVSRGESEAEYRFDLGGGVAGSGRLETVLTAVHPYGRWTFANGLELRGVLGAGSGEARHLPADGEAETSGLDMRMASLGLRRPLRPLGGTALAARAEASAVRMETGAGPGPVSNVTADAWRLRAGLEASRRIVLDGGSAALEPFLEVAMRRDGGDGVTGSGVEVAGGVRYAAPGVSVEARGRWLAAHSAAGTRERGASVTARFGPGANGPGLSLSLSPRWGAETGGAEALWQDGLPAHSGAASGAALDARVAYGTLSSRGLVTTFAETGLADGGSRRLRTGMRLDARRADLGLEISGERREDGAAEPVHVLGLDLGYRF